MNASLYVEKATGDREVMDDVGMEMARAVFEKMDWDAELAAVQAAQDSGTEVFLPEFGLTDPDERTLIVSPVDANTVSFYMQYPDRVAGAQSFPKSEVGQLLGLYYQGFDDGIAALIAKSAPPAEVPIRELTDAEFRATIVQPMVRLGDEQNYREVHVRDYLASCIIKHNLPVTLNSIELTDIFVAADRKHSHIMFNYGDPEKSLVIVAEHGQETGDVIYGYFFFHQE